MDIATVELKLAEGEDVAVEFKRCGNGIDQVPAEARDMYISLFEEVYL